MKWIILNYLTAKPERNEFPYIFLAA